MKILFLSTWHPYPPDNGSKLRVYHLLRALNQAHQVTLLSFAFDTAVVGEVEPLRQWCTRIDTVAVDPFTANRSSALRTFLSPSPIAARAVPAMQQLVAQALREHSFDAVIASTEMMAVYALQAPSTTAKILEEHNSFTRWMQERYTEQTRAVQRLRCWASWQKTRFYETRLFRQFDLVTMVSAQDRAVSLADLPGYRGLVEVVPNGVDCQHSRPSLGQPQHNTLVYNGSLTYSANYDAMRWFLAEVYPQIRQVIPGVTLTITGSTRGVDLNSLRMDDSVRLTGFVNDVRMPVAEASLCVAPIRQGGGTRLKILEAMALGTPVVATSKGAQGLTVADGEHLLIADTATDFARATLRLLTDANLHSNLATAARRLVETRYDWSSIGPYFVNLVETTVAQLRVAHHEGVTL